MKIRSAGSIAKGFTDNITYTYRQLMRGDRNIMIFIIYGLLFDVFMNLHRPFNVKFLTRLGGGEFHVALLNSLPGIVAVFAIIPGSLIINRFANKKGVISVFFGAARLFVLALVFVPFLPPLVRPMLFVLLMSLMNFPDAISQTGLQSFLGDVFDGVSRSRAIALRNKFGQIVAPVIAIATGLVITLIPRGDEAARNNQAIVIYQVFFALAFAVAILEVFVFRKFKERGFSAEKTAEEAPEKPEKPRLTAREKLSVIPATLKDKKFVAFLLPTLFFHFMLHSGWPLFGILQVITLEATELHMAVNAAVAGVAGFIGAGFWSKMLRKKGNDFTCFVSSVGLAVGMMFSAAAPNIYIYILIQTLAGFSNVGIMITILNGLLAATPEKNRVIYISVYNTFINISLGVSPFFAYAVLNWAGVRWATFIIGVGRVLASLALLAIYIRNRRTKTA